MRPGDVIGLKKFVHDQGASTFTFKVPNAQTRFLLLYLGLSNLKEAADPAAMLQAIGWRQTSIWFEGNSPRAVVSDEQLEVALLAGLAEVRRRSGLGGYSATLSDMASVCYRPPAGPYPTEAEYDEAIQALQDAKTQLKPNADHCHVCGDSGDWAGVCHHNPLVLARRWARSTRVYQCYHCGFVAQSDEEAQGHFGKNDEEVAKCVRESPEVARAILEKFVTQLSNSCVPTDFARHVESFIQNLEKERA